MLERRLVNWADMPNMGEEALAGYVPQDKPMFTAIRNTLLKHGAIKKFGIYLVHRHFDIADGEEMVEHVDFEKSTIVVRPIKIVSPNASRLVPTNWFFDDDPNRLGLHVAQWGFEEDLANAERNPFSEAYLTCFEEIRAILLKYSSIHRFGMFLVRNQFPYEIEVNQLECTDQETRTLTVSPEPENRDRDDTIPTNWVFTPDDTVATACCQCARSSQGHLGAHQSS